MLFPRLLPRRRPFVRFCNPLALPKEIFQPRSRAPDVAEGVDFFYSDWADMNLPTKHRFPMDKYTMTRRALEEEGLSRILPGPLGTVEEACLAHDRGYVESIVTGRATDAMRKRVGFFEAPMEAYVLRTMASLGATLAATRRCLHSGVSWSGAISGGTHHAFPAAGEGFCVFNDIAVAARVAQLEFGISSVLIVDLDVHQGNGTAKIFENDDQVFTFSVHQAKGFPFSTRCSSDIDIGLPDGIGDEEFLNALAPLAALVKERQPGLLIYQAGVDGLKGDRFGRWTLTREGLAKRNDIVYSIAAEAGVPVLVTMGGGYHPDITKTVECSTDVYRQAALAWRSLEAASDAPRASTAADRARSTPATLRGEFAAATASARTGAVAARAPP